MPGKRTTTPLFDLLQQGRRGGAEPRPAEPPTPDPQERAPRESHAGGLTEAPIRIVGGVVQMPILYASIALALALAAIVAGWTLGYQRGERQARADQRLLESALGPEARVVEPGSGGQAPRTNGSSGVGSVPNAGQDPGQTTGQSGRRAAPNSQAAFLTPRGPSNTDPRMAQHNYLRLGSNIREREVLSAIDFLGDRGIGCFGRFESAARRGNDGPLFVLYADLGFPSGEADSSQARQYREQVVAAGAAWKAAGGVRSFDDAGWELYKGN